MKFYTGIGKYFSRGDGRDTHEYRLDSYLATDPDVSEARTCGTQETGQFATRHIGRFDGN